MTDVNKLARELGVDPAAVQTILQFAQKGEIEEQPGEIQGFVSCINGACDRHGEDRPITLAVDQVQRTYKDQGGDLGFLSTGTTYYHPVDDSELICPDCRMPCSIIPGKRRVIPNHTAGMVR